MSLALERQRWLALSEFKASRVCTASFRTVGATQRNHGPNKTKRNQILNYNHRITHKEHEGTQVWRRKLSLISLATLLNLKSTGSRELELDIIKNCQILNKRCLKTSTYYLNRIKNT